MYNHRLHKKFFLCIDETRQINIGTALRCGIFPLRIGIGRYACNYISENERLCFLTVTKLKMKILFLFYCDHQAYSDIRESFYSEITNKCENFVQLNDKQNILIHWSNRYVYDFSKYVKKRKMMYR